jgi:hypothetical protein
VKLTRKSLEKRGEDEDRRWPGYLFGGRVRTSTLVLIVALMAVWWVYDTYRPEPAPKPPAPQVVPPGFVPDPAYTWVPRTRVQPSPTPTSTPTTTAPPPETTTMPPSFTSPQLPCLLPPPFCPPSTTPATPPSPQPQPGSGPAPTSRQPAS